MTKPAHEPSTHRRKGSSAPSDWHALGQLLLARDVLTKEALEAAVQEQEKTGELLGTILIRHGVSKDVLLGILAEQLSMPYLGLEQLQPKPEALAKIPVKLASQYSLLPLQLDNGSLQVAMADPFNVQWLDELKLLTGCRIKAVLATESDIRQAIKRWYGMGAGAIEHMLAGNGEGGTALAMATPQLLEVVDEASMAAFVNEMISHAIVDRATDIHIEPYEGATRIRERIDGVLYEMATPAGLGALHQVLVSRIKIMARLDITEKRLPQDGRVKVRVHEQAFDLRISILPTRFGESVDIRILSSGMLFSLGQLGLAEDHLQVLSDLIARPHGIILVTGPTGSGKTTTLYACLSKLNTLERKILTIEDPVEYQLSGITQIQVHPKIGLTFAQGLRSMLRHDPDIMMVGEVRDPETAEITIRSALTGHLVFSTLHTNDAAGGVARLLEMGIEPYLVTSSILGFIAQRLVRVLCKRCQEPVVPSPELRHQFGVADVPATVLRNRGCDACKHTGFQGRTAIYEFLVVDEQIQQLILRRGSAREISRVAQQAGMRTMRQDGWLKVLAGITTPQEVLRVT